MDIKPSAARAASEIKVSTYKTSTAHANAAPVAGTVPSLHSDAQVAPPTATPTPEVKGEARSEQLSLFARKEQALRAQARKLQADRQAFEAEKTAKPGSMTKEEWKAQFLKGPENVGLSYEEMASRYLNQPSSEDQRYSALQAELADVRAKLAANESKIEETSTSAYKAALKQIDFEVGDVISANAEKYELITAEKAQNQVTAYIDLTYKEDGKILSAEEAANHIEEYLVEKAMAYSKLKKIQAQLTSQQVQAQEAQKNSPSGQTATATLTNQMVGGASGSKPMSRRDRAIAVMLGQKT